MDSIASTPSEVQPWLRLTLVPGVGPSMQQRLLAKLGGTPQAVLEAGRESIARIADADVADALIRGPAPRLLETTLEWLARPGNGLITLHDPRYPELLRHVDPPPTVLYVQGRVELLSAPSFAVVGSRNGSTQGCADARSFAQTLSEAGLCIVSGLALGIDAAAHRGGLSARGSSVAVVGTGLDEVYPRENAALARELATEGCIASEFPLGTPPVPRNFPRRNRLITGLSKGVLVVEAGLRSGSLISAARALDQGRDVFALPGSIHSPLSKGCHQLIKQGAKLVEEAADILEELRWPARPAAPGLFPGSADPLLDVLGFAPASIDDIVARTSLAANEIAAWLSLLEIEGCVEPVPGGMFRRVVRPRGGDAKTAL